ncbi:MAG: translation elongation factor 4 [bacterium]|nr:translation elongation factor 4 [bacterium]
MDNIRNFSIIAHIDHGKSTLADRMLQLTKTVEVRLMRDQVLDQMDLERERGITIKMQPVRMVYEHTGNSYVLNLIDTPGHIDFSYEVSRALKAVEGAILLVDATQGVQAQTLTTLEMAQDLGLTIIPVVNKIDMPAARVDDTKIELAELVGCEIDDVLEVSGKTGSGVEELLAAVIKRVPAPKKVPDVLNSSRTLVFDFEYSNHRGVIVYGRVFEGSVKAGDKLRFVASEREFLCSEVGIFSPLKVPKDKLFAGEIGYMVTAIKEPSVARVGDTLTHANKPLGLLSGYQEPNPVVWASVYPESQDDFTALRQALERLQLSDSSLVFEEEASSILGRGFRCGLLGMLHLEIVSERLRREFDLDLIITSPTISYEVVDEKGNMLQIYSPTQFPDNPKGVREQWVNATIIVPPEYLGGVVQLLHEHEAFTKSSGNFTHGRSSLVVEMPLRELMRGFFDELKSVSSGYASLSYEITEYRNGDVTRMDVLVGSEVIPAFTKIISTVKAQREAEELVDRLEELIPRHMFEFKVQAVVNGRIIASRTKKAFRKDVTGYLYGGDVTRKRKLLEKQKKGKKKMKGAGKVIIPAEVFVKAVR